MQAFLSLADSDREHPNENYARELHGAVHARRRQRLLRARRARGGPRAHGLPRPLGRRAALPRELRPQPARPGRQGHLRPPRALRLARRPRPRRRPPAPRRLPRGQAVGLLRHRAARPRHPAAADPDLRPLRPPHRARRRARSSSTRRSTPTSRHPRMVKAPIVLVAGMLRADRARRRHRRLGLDLRPDGPDALPPALRRGMGLGAGVDVDRDHGRPLPGRHLDDEGPARQGPRGRGAARPGPRPSTSPARAGPRARRGRRAPPTPSC